MTIRHKKAGYPIKISLFVIDEIVGRDIEKTTIDAP